MVSRAIVEEQRREFGLAPPLQIAPAVLRMNFEYGLVHRYTLTANVFVGEPSQPPNIGDLVRLILTEDGTGSRSVTWGVCFRDAPAWSPGAANTMASAIFIWDGLSYQYAGGSSAFAVSGLSVVPSSGIVALNTDPATAKTNPAPTGAALSLAGVAPTLTAITVKNIVPTVGAVAITGVAPGVSTLLTPSVGAMSVSSLPPTRSP